MTRPTLSKSLALPAATLGALAASSASGAISYFDITDINVLDGGDTIYFDLQTGAAGTSTASVAGWDAKLWSASYDANMAGAWVYTSAPTFSLRGYTYAMNALRLNAGASFGGSYTPVQYLSVFAGTLRNEFLPGFVQGYWGPGTASGTGYLGLAILNSAGDFNYGWAHLTFNADRSLTLHDFAIETNANAPIQTGAIPEPSTYAALTGLLAGSAVLYARRRKRAT
jgi:hypothetical protein